VAGLLAVLAGDSAEDADMKVKRIPVANYGSSITAKRLPNLLNMSFLGAPVGRRWVG
jgi:hypothetical protein